MRLLADESCDFTVVRFLRDHGYDVLAVCEISPGAEDSKVIDLAVSQRRIVLTEDKDFGQLVYAHGQKTLGVIFVRGPASARKQISDDVLKLVQERGEGLVGCWVVLQPGRTRISRTPRD